LNVRLCLAQATLSSLHTCRCMWCTWCMPGMGSMATMLTFRAATSSPPLRSRSGSTPRSLKRSTRPSPYGSTLSGWTRNDLHAMRVSGRAVVPSMLVSGTT